MPHATLAPVSLDLSSGASSGITSLPPSVDPRIVETEKRLHQMQSSQILLGLVGARAAPKADVSILLLCSLMLATVCFPAQSRRLVSHLDKAGVRFVYASPQSFKRTKNIAGKLGLETDWNCGISLAETRQPHKDKRYPMEEKQDPGMCLCVWVGVLTMCVCVCCGHRAESMFHNENMDEDEHFGEGVLTVTAMKKKILNKVSPRARIV